MIRFLAIRNLAVIESVAVDFEHSFNILTGETGAGKSILLDAFALALGAAPPLPGAPLVLAPALSPTNKVK